MKTHRVAARAAGIHDRSGQAASVLDLVECAYAVDLPDPIWGGQLLRSVQELVRCDLGGFICSWERPNDGPEGVTVHSPIAVGIAEKHADQIFEGMAKAPSAWVRGIIRSVPALGRCVLTSEIDPHGHLAYRSRFREYGSTDGVNLIARDLDDRGFLISVAVRAGDSMTQTLRRDLTKGFTHVLAALRLRARLSAVRTRRIEGPEPDAIFTPEGRLMHARGGAELSSARLALERAVHTIEQARAGGLEGPEQALSRWRGLVSARWSLVDTFERDGTRYVVARENRPEAIGLGGLTPTESLVVAYAARGLTTKETAYALGLSDSTIRVLMMRAMRRCGLKNRRALLDAWARHQAEAPTPCPPRT